MLRCEGLTLAVPERVLVRDLEFEARRGEIWAVLGANGSGKTTLVQALAGLAQPAAGTVTLDGAPLAARRYAARACLVGILLQQEEAGFWGSVFAYVLLGRFPHARSWYGWSRADVDAVDAALAACGLTGLMHRGYQTLSGGERQRARIAQLLAQDPRVLLLDEPLQHLDLKHQLAVLRLTAALARDRGKAVMMVLHDALWPARLCTHALLLHDGGQVESGAAEAMLSRERLERLYGCPLREAGSGAERLFVPIL